MHSLNIDIEKMEEEIRQLDVEATQAVAENKGKDDQWQQVSQSREDVDLRLVVIVCKNGQGSVLTRRACVEQIKVNTMERVNKLTLQDEKLETGIAETQLLIKRLDTAARQICRYHTSACCVKSRHVASRV